MNTLAAWLDRYSLYIALLVAWVATLGSLYFSEVAGYIPCTLCWYQRILMYPLALLLAVGLLRWDEHLPVLVLPFSVAGLGLATYHYLLEKTDLFTESAICSTGASCTIAWINWFGFVTIPFLSLLGFLLITLMALIALNAGEPSPPPDAAPPYLPVIAIVALCIGAYALLAWYRSQPAAAPVFTVVYEELASQAQSRKGGANGLAAEPGTIGKRLYDGACANCHGAQGEGVVALGSPLAGSTWIQGQSETELLSFLRAGRAADDPSNQSGIAMPPSGGRPDLTDSDLLAIIRYLRMDLAAPAAP